ncbi:MAG: hypothetical protein IKF58_13860, partial [Bacillus sp. (in: Bacteria)]|nr:hypothetical protein [Bacillus sp. (in: firmicutes)]
SFIDAEDGTFSDICFIYGLFHVADYTFDYFLTTFAISRLESVIYRYYSTPIYGPCQTKKHRRSDA